VTIVIYLSTMRPVEQKELAVRHLEVIKRIKPRKKKNMMKKITWVMTKKPTRC
jgi:hypothetical protein